MADIEFFVLLAVVLWLWWIVPRRRYISEDMQRILNALERIETKLGTNPEAIARIIGKQ